MEATTVIRNLETYNEKRFDLPLDMTEVEEFLDNNTDDYEITDVDDNYALLMRTEAYKTNLKNLSELVELIENTNDIEDTTTKILYHYVLNGDTAVSQIISDFDSILDKYSVYKNTTPELWAETNNEEYMFIGTTDIQQIYHNFGDKDIYLRDLTATFGLGEKLEEKIYDMSLSDMLDTLDEMGLLHNDTLSVSSYLDWKKIVKDLRASAVYIDKFKDKVIVHNG
ncbi:MAG: hypothetical protein U9N59_15240 [Campylobacterota bacterium]|nr:hypothetical protein [Campylobacterota bacterium]